MVRIVSTGLAPIAGAPRRPFLIRASTKARRPCSAAPAVLPGEPGAAGCGLGRDPGAAGRAGPVDRAERTGAADCPVADGPSGRPLRTGADRPGRTAWWRAGPS